MNLTRPTTHPAESGFEQCLLRKPISLTCETQGRHADVASGTCTHQHSTLHVPGASGGHLIIQLCKMTESLCRQMCGSFGFFLFPDSSNCFFL